MAFTLIDDYSVHHSLDFASWPENLKSLLSGLSRKSLLTPILAEEDKPSKAKINLMGVMVKIRGAVT